jgi:hypothetical protein
MLIAPGVPIGPGAKVPPLRMVAAPTAPVPVSSAPFPTVTAELAIEPVTTSAPPLTVVGPL